MSISRSFTTKRPTRTSDVSPPMPSRSLTTKHHHFSSGTIRHKISAPIELISTTNMLSYNAPDIYPKAASASSTSSRASNSGDDSDRSPTTASSPTTSPESSDVGSTPSSPQPNHLSCYFGAPSHQSNPSDPVPAIPQRALSHTKKNAEILARKRSTSRISSTKNSISTVRSSVNIFAPEAEAEVAEEHPFGHELAQVTELAEEYGISQAKMDVVDEEEQELISKGLFKFRAEDYMSEIQGLFMSAFGDVKPSRPAMWI
ncbi:Uncharacterized protein BP5553_05984 [Venustampulla echinocandica]|uniref:Uncharacterized protein n=1 Tax=Venustampulla echinocandica TaxID=2656787 RepID=A0A370TM89_9HELO|nr:Uncharacterized protein BP5553_05984 [Venustampulla echinocandica]RDL36632.1 Uncharacterized protein BP5553_05984 [Venustampulla echinocandica]